MINYLDEDKILLTLLSRHKTDTDLTPGGIFIGGELLSNEFDRKTNKMNDTGMAYFDGTRWYHICCTSNEGLTTCTTMEPIPATSWTFLGSDVIKKTRQTLILKSSHAAAADGNPILIDRYAIFIAGKTYMFLIQRITNVGENIASFYYVYGDEPWLGNFGSSVGNIGWVSDHLIKYEEKIDVNKYKYFGFYDYRNDVIGEGHTFTGMASFIEWINNRPDVAFIVNQENGVIPRARKNMPLNSKLARFIDMQWGHVYLPPKASFQFVLVIGMANVGKDGKIPEKPPVFFNIS